MREHRDGRRVRWRSCAALAVFGAATVLGHGVASGSASSGQVYWTTSGPYLGGSADNCLISNIIDTAYNEGWILAYRSPNGCSGSLVNMPATWIGVNAAGFRGGSYCNSTGVSYNSTSIGYWAVGGSMCSNPPGLQTFATLAYGTVWTQVGGTWQYVTGSVQASPGQSY